MVMPAHRNLCTHKFLLAVQANVMLYDRNGQHFILPKHFAAFKNTEMPPGHGFGSDFLVIDRLQGYSAPLTRSSK